MPARSAINAVIFDVDGVLTDSEPLIHAAATAMFREKGLAVHPEDFHPFVGTDEDRCLGGVAEKYTFSIDLGAARKRTCEIYLELVPSRLKAFPGAVGLVLACKNAGLKIAVASSADRIRIDANLNEIALPRQIAMYLLSEEHDLSLSAIGEQLGGRDHSTIRYGIDQVRADLERDDTLRNHLMTLREKIYRPVVR